MQLRDVFIYSIGNKAYLIQWASDIETCECCGQKHETDPEPIGVIEGDIVARKFVEDTDPQHWENSGVFYRVCVERRNGKPLKFRNVEQGDLFSTKEQAEQELRKLKNEMLKEAKRTCEFCKHNIMKGCYNNGVNNPECRFMTMRLTANDFCSKFKRDD